MKRWLILTLFILIAVPAGLWYSSHGEVHAIVPGEIFRSAQLSGAQFTKAIEKHGLKTIISLRQPDQQADWYREELAAVSAAGVTHHSLGMLQSSPTYDRVIDLYQLLQSAPRPLLVHCRSGVDRSGLAGVMTMLLNGQGSLEIAARQASWRFAALKPRSAGKVFLAAYRQWLDRQGKAHTPETFGDWLEHDYVDPTGNVHFLVHPVGGKPWLKPLGGNGGQERFHVEREAAERLELDGWALDSYRRAQLADVEVFLGGQPLGETAYGLPTPWLQAQFGTDAYVATGWSASHPMAGVPDGCHELTFRFIRQDGTAWSSPPAGRICID
jgi:undecaprenyl-diphosphatase